MLKARYARAALGVVCVLTVSACVTLPPNSQRPPQDPWESWNRGVYKFNDKLDRAVAKPVAKTYVRIVPQPIRTGVSKFFENLDRDIALHLADVKVYKSVMVELRYELRGHRGESRNTT